MKKSTKKWLIAAAVLIIAGTVIAAAVCLHINRDFPRLNTQQLVTTAVGPEESFEGISIKTDSADVSVLPAEDGKCRVVCREYENMQHTVSVIDGTLTVSENDSREWIDKIAFSVSEEAPAITVYLPAKEYGSLQVNDYGGNVSIPDGFTFTDIAVFGQNGEVECGANVKNSIEIETYSGDTELVGVSAKSIKLDSYSGKTELKNITCSGKCEVNNDMGDLNAEHVACGSFLSDAFSGEARLKDVIADTKMKVKRESGDIRLHSSDAGELYLRTESGCVSGTVLTEKVFLTETQTGNVSVPKTTAGGKCEIITEWGDIDISID